MAYSYVDYEKLIRMEVAKLPSACHRDYHEWVNGYGSLAPWNYSETKSGAQMLPYYVCKHCQAIGPAITTAPSAIKLFRITN